jgi:hypothetical protein
MGMRSTKEVLMRTNFAGAPDDLGKWLAVAAALAGAGLLPRTWQKALSATAALLVLLKR